MQSEKRHVHGPYTNRAENHHPAPAPAVDAPNRATPTARLVHVARADAGEPRPRHRPYKAPAAPALCAGCGATYHRRRWNASSQAVTSESRPDQPLGLKLCPACRRRDANVPKGVVHVDGDWTHAHRDDVTRLLDAEISRAGTASPAAQVVYRGGDGCGGLLLATTTEHLAVRLGRALEAAYDGELHYGFANDNTLAHVWWRRD